MNHGHVAVLGGGCVRGGVRGALADAAAATEESEAGFVAAGKVLDPAEAVVRMAQLRNAEWWTLHNVRAER